MRTANYVQETTTSIAGTNGDGAVTTTAIANTPRVSTVFGTGKVEVRYTIEDTVNKKMESGFGSVTGNVLTRSRPQTTWDGTTWKDGSTGAVTALAFGSTPAAGNVLIRLGPVAETQAPVVPGRQTLIAGDSQWRDYVITQAINYWSGNTPSTLTANNEYYAYHKLDTAGLLTGLQLEVRAVGGTGLKLALYNVGSNGLPGSKILDFNVASTLSTGLKTDTSTATWSTGGPVWLTPGWYAIGFISDGGGQISGTGQGGNLALGHTPLGRKNAYGYSACAWVAGSYTNGLPTSPNLTGGTMVDVGSSGLAWPWIGLKVVA
jgi:hypothetical protein